MLKFFLNKIINKFNFLQKEKEKQKKLKEIQEKFQKIKLAEREF